MKTKKIKEKGICLFLVKILYPHKISECVQSRPSEYGIIVLHTGCKLSGLCRCRLQTKMGPFPPPSDCNHPCQSKASHCYIFSLRELFSRWSTVAGKLSCGWHWIRACQKQLPFLFSPVIFQWVFKFHVLQELVYGISGIQELVSTLVKMGRDWALCWEDIKCYQTQAAWRQSNLACLKEWGRKPKTVCTSTNGSLDLTSSIQCTHSVMPHEAKNTNGI